MAFTPSSTRKSARCFWYDSEAVLVCREASDCSFSAQGRLLGTGQKYRASIFTIGRWRMAGVGEGTIKWGGVLPNGNENASRNREVVVLDKAAFSERASLVKEIVSESPTVTQAAVSDFRVRFRSFCFMLRSLSNMALSSGLPSNFWVFM